MLTMLTRLPPANRCASLHGQQERVLAWEMSWSLRAASLSASCEGLAFLAGGSSSSGASTSFLRSLWLLGRASPAPGMVRFAQQVVCKGGSSKRAH